MNDKEIIEILKTNGMNENVAQLLIELRTASGLTQKEIMERTNLHQPEVSIATAQAYQAGWIRYDIFRRKENGTNRAGRPYYRYSLSKPFPEIISDVASDRAQAIAGMMDDLKALQAVV